MKYLNLYDYFDYRSFLADYYAKRKAREPKFSHRYFAMKAGYNSSGYFSNLVKGTNNLSDKYIDKFIVGLELNEKEAQWFRHMVDYTHAASAQAKQDIFDQMVKLLPKKMRRLKSRQREFYSKWYYVAVHQLLAVMDFSDDYPSLARRVSPPLRVPEAKNAIRLLEELGLILKDQNSFYRPSEQAMIGGKEVGTQVIHEFQNHMMDLAKDSQCRVEPEERQIQTTTVTVNAKSKARIQAKIKQMQQEIFDIIQSESNEDQVYQLNLQFFPLSAKPKDP
jgi:uncharacterized protein (TIGR02147 family)